MPEALALLVSQGPLGLVAGVFIYLYLAERRRSHDLDKEHAKELAELRKEHTEKLDGVRQAQIEREQEVAKTLEEYGRSIVDAVGQATFLSRELRRFYDRDR